MLRRNKIFVFTQEKNVLNLYVSNDIPKNFDSSYLNRIHELFYNGIVENKEYCVVNKTVRFIKVDFDLEHKVCDDIIESLYNNIYFINLTNTDIIIPDIKSKVINTDVVDLFHFVEMRNCLSILKKSIVYSELCIMNLEPRSRDRYLSYLNNITERIRS